MPNAPTCTAQPPLAGGAGLQARPRSRWARRFGDLRRRARCRWQPALGTRAESDRGRLGRRRLAPVLESRPSGRAAVVCGHGSTLPTDLGHRRFVDRRLRRCRWRFAAVAAAVALEPGTGVRAEVDGVRARAVRRIGRVGRIRSRFTPRQQFRNQQRRPAGRARWRRSGGLSIGLPSRADYRGTPSRASAGPTVWNDPNTTMRSPGRACVGAHVAMASAIVPAGGIVDARRSRALRSSSTARDRARALRRCAANHASTQSRKCRTHAGTSLSPSMPQTANVRPVTGSAAQVCREHASPQPGCARRRAPTRSRAHRRCAGIARCTCAGRRPLLDGRARQRQPVARATARPSAPWRHCATWIGPGNGGSGKRR